MPDEPLPVKLSYAVIRGVDSGRIGRAVDVLTMEDVFGGSLRHGRLPRRWRAVWLELEFPEGDRGAYRLDDLEARHG